MDDQSSAEQKAKKGCLFLWIIIGLVILSFVLALLPIKGGDFINGKRVSVRNVQTQIVAAILSYETEYGHLPGNRTDGSYEDSVGNAQIFNTLRAMDQQQNPRSIVFFEARNARVRKRHWWEPAKLKDGFDPATGILYDLYGQPYRIHVAPISGRSAVSPYKDAPAKDEHVIAWSLGEDERQGSKDDPGRFQGSDDIASWKQ